jgi:hypothetical protein
MIYSASMQNCNAKFLLLWDKQERLMLLMILWRIYFFLLLVSMHVQRTN